MTLLSALIRLLFVLTFKERPVCIIHFPLSVNQMQKFSNSPKLIRLHPKPKLLASPFFIFG